MANSEDELKAALAALGPEVGIKRAKELLTAQGFDVDTKRIRELRAASNVVEAPASEPEPIAPTPAAEGKQSAPAPEPTDPLTESLRSKILALSQTLKSLVDDRSAYFREGSEPLDVLKSADLILDMLSPGVTLVLDRVAHDLDWPGRPTVDVQASFKSSVDHAFALMDETMKLHIRIAAARNGDAETAVRDHVRRKNDVEQQAINVAVQMKDWATKRKLKDGKPAFPTPSRSSVLGKATGKLYTNREHGEALKAMFGRA